MKIASRVAASVSSSRSTSAMSICLHSCVTMFRFVMGMVWRGGVTSSSPSLPSRTNSTRASTYFSKSPRRISVSASRPRALHHFHRNGW